jgi:hypothetical protein
MAGMAFCSEFGITRAFGPGGGAPAVRGRAGQVPSLGADTH